MSCVKILQPLLFIFNLLFWLGGVICLALGIYLLFIADPSAYFDAHSTHPGSWRTVGWLLIAAGLPIALIGCCGCWGAYRLNQPALLCFFLLLIIVFSLELVAAYVAYHKQANARRFVEASMYDTVRNRYGSDDNYKDAFDKIQTSFECCGVKSYSDWLGAAWDGKKAGDDKSQEDLKPEHGIGALGGRGNGFGRVPTSCCNEHGLTTYPSNCGVSFTHAPLSTYEQFLHPKGCSDALFDFADTWLNIIILVCVSVGILQLLGIVLSMCLCCCLNAKQSKEYDY
ncbi:unnamed protein product, partial [Mesorhabditis belari]|uniref:Tetraspanin n=1 Tax=Mesorhabditis belari TaxID=2138241 RepID=A0AAF3EB22_9BILA